MPCKIDFQAFFTGKKPTEYHSFMDNLMAIVLMSELVSNANVALFQPTLTHKKGESPC